MGSASMASARVEHALNTEEQLNSKSAWESGNTLESFEFEIGGLAVVCFYFTELWCFDVYVGSECRKKSHRTKTWTGSTSQLGNLQHVNFIAHAWLI
jgi:hypothetical protein